MDIGKKDKFARDAVVDGIWKLEDGLGVRGK